MLHIEDDSVLLHNKHLCSVRIQCEYQIIKLNAAVRCDTFQTLSRAT